MIDRNNLDRATSPYLLQHAANPVHWQPWGPAALAAAQAANKPILLSVGYAACHWCHVMAHESFAEPATAALMNEHFVNIKVDREERPDIDAIYQAALALLGQHGGWPLTMFLTPAAEPFWGGTYFPPEPRFGRPGFPEVLQRIAGIFHNDPETIAKNRDALLRALRQLTSPAASGGAAQAGQIDTAAQRLLGLVDPVHGGIDGAPKFPQAPVLELLWRAYRRRRGAMFKHAVVLTLERISHGGIYDHLGGGYARYATDAEWLVPHFEKMLYDNAQLLDLLAAVWADGRQPLFAQRAAETVDWLVREMLLDGGAFAAALDADTDGEEGLFYVWQEDEIDRLLGADAPAFKAAYDVRPGGNWESRTILNRLQRPDLGSSGEEARLAHCRAVLLAARARREHPARDDKVLADWNGLTIAALAHGAMVLSKPDWLDHAKRAFAFVTGTMQRGDRLGHSWRAGQLQPEAMLDDYANLSRAALALYECTADRTYVDQAERWVAALDAHYWDGDRGGYFFTAADAETLIARQRSCADQATPAGNGTMVGVLSRLWALTGAARYRDRAGAILNAFAGAGDNNAFALATLLNNFDLHQGLTHVVVVARPGDPAAAALLGAVWGAGNPNRLIAHVAPDEALPPGHPAEGKTQRQDQPTAYVCIGETCSLPLTDPAELAAALSRR